ncbi:P1 family peptidase [Sporomusa aerivorans]|uniref:P1 family peptidase n=1 Tax=Sporomusa aerivorans TaxID=204936 RepID=UPI00352A0475
MERVNFAAIPSIKIGHMQNLSAGTGCTVIICDNPTGAVGGVDVRGGAPGTRETDVLRSENTVERINAVLLAGGSAFGLDAAGGVMQFLEEKGIGYDVGVTKVPIVPQAILFDLTFGDHRVRPDKMMAYQACQNAYSQTPWTDGNTGAGAGATVGKIKGMAYAMKGGLGSCCYRLKDLYVGAIVAVNAFGDVVSPANGAIVAGALQADKKTFLNTESFTVTMDKPATPKVTLENTTIGVIVTNARLTKPQANKLAALTQNAYARVIRPVHTIHDGDTVFTLATAEVTADMTLLGILAIRAMEQAIVSSVQQAATLHGVPGAADRRKAY